MRNSENEPTSGAGLVNVSDRRGAIRWIAGLVAAGCASAAAASDACFDLTKLPRSDLSLRRSLGFKEHAADAVTCCATCAFFAQGQGQCGSCALLSGGPVSTSSVCGSWAKKG